MSSGRNPWGVDNRDLSTDFLPNFLFLFFKKLYNENVDLWDKTILGYAQNDAKKTLAPRNAGLKFFMPIFTVFFLIGVIVWQWPLIKLPVVSAEKSINNSYAKALVALSLPEFSFPEIKIPKISFSLPFLNNIFSWRDYVVSLGRDVKNAALDLIAPSSKKTPPASTSDVEPAHPAGWSEKTPDILPQEKPSEKTSAQLQPLTSKYAIGQSGEHVKLLQQYLMKDPAIYPEQLITGYYDEPTKKAVERFQQKYGIEVTGIAGPLTRAKLSEVYGR